MFLVAAASALARVRQVWSKGPEARVFLVAAPSGLPGARNIWNAGPERGTSGIQPGILPGSVQDSEQGGGTQEDLLHLSSQGLSQPGGGETP